MDNIATLPQLGDDGRRQADDLSPIKSGQQKSFRLLVAWASFIASFAHNNCCRGRGQVGIRLEKRGSVDSNWANSGRGRCKAIAIPQAEP